jgi:hypothetical protein
MGEDLVDQIRIGDVCDDPQHPAAGGTAAESLRCLWRRACAGVAMIARRISESGAKTPW